MTENAPDTTHHTVISSSGSVVRWWVAVGVGMVVSVPLAWLLSHGALLPFFIGLFFFVLFGLVIGAVIHRIAAPSRPYPRLVIFVGTTLIVLGGWTFSIVKESRDFPVKQAKDLSRNPRLNLGDQTIEAYRTAVEKDIRVFFKDQYPPGGTIGYVRWIVTSGELPSGVAPGITRRLTVPQHKLMWVIRVVLSIALFAFGIGSQTFPLRLERETMVRAIDEKPHGSKSVST